MKSVTLAEYRPEEVEAMRAGGNTLAATRYLARFTPGRDLPKPTDRCVGAAVARRHMVLSYTT